MSEITQYKFSLAEVASSLITQQGIHDGKWIAVFEFGFNASIIGATPENSYPTAMLQIQSMILQEASALAPDTAGVVDATQVNPVPKKPKAAPTPK